MSNSIITTNTAAAQLVKIIQSDFNGDSINAVNARDLHLFLGSRQNFADWIKGRINDYGFSEDQDFIIILGESTGGRPSKEYHITMDMAKEVSMVERNEKGKQARKYFIQCEKAVKAGIIPSTTMPLATTELKACVEMAHIFGLKGNQALLSANTAVKNLHGINCMETLGITGLIAEDKKQYFTPTILGKKVGMSAVQFNKALEASGMQKANRDHKKRLVWQVTETGKPYCELLDTNKKHSDGTPIMQIKWCEYVIDSLV